MFLLQIQNCVFRRINVHYKDRFVGMLVEYLSLQTQIRSVIPMNCHCRYDFGLDTNELCNYFGYNGMFMFVLKGFFSVKMQIVH